MNLFGSSKRRTKSPKAKLNKVLGQIQKEKVKVELKKAKATLAQMKFRA